MVQKHRSGRLFITSHLTKISKKRTPEGYPANLREQFIAKNPDRQQHKSFSANQASSAVLLAAYRGEHAGLCRAYLLLKKEFPEAAQYILATTGMNKRESMADEEKIKDEQET